MDDPVFDAMGWSERSRQLAQLLAQTALGDRRAFAELYERTSGHLFAVLLRIQRDRSLAEDLLQEVYVSVWKAAGSFDAAAAQPLTWLTHIARNRAIDSLRRARARPPTEPLDGDDEEGDRRPGVADEAPGPLDLLTRAADARQLGQCMEQLSARQRQSVALTFFHGLTHAEVALQMREPLGTVKSWVRRALGALRGCLDRAVAREAGRPAEAGAPTRRVT